MVGNIVDCAIRLMLATLGIGGIAAAAITDGNDKETILIKILIFLGSMIMLLLSVFFTGFMVHLANHSKDRRLLFEDINKRLTEIKNAVCPTKKEKDKEDEE